MLKKKKNLQGPWGSIVMALDYNSWGSVTSWKFNRRELGSKYWGEMICDKWKNSKRAQDIWEFNVTEGQKMSEGSSKRWDEVSGVR